MVVFFCRFSDEISFDRLSLARVRRAANAAAAAIGSPFTPLFDLHTGGGAQDPSPPACSYAGHYPFMDYVWNGEDFTFGSGPDYWLIEISSQQHGVTGDLLGSGSSGASVFRGMLYGMVDRNSAPAQSLWRFWDDVGINATTAIGWWEDDAVAFASSAGGCGGEGTLPVTTYVAFGSHAVIVLASWCGGDAADPAVLTVDWPSLGMNASSAVVTAPAIPSVQSAAGPFDANAIRVPFVAAGGIILVVTNTGA